MKRGVHVEIPATLMYQEDPKAPARLDLTAPKDDPEHTLVHVYGDHGQTLAGLTLDLAALKRLYGAAGDALKLHGVDLAG